LAEISLRIGKERIFLMNTVRSDTLRYDDPWLDQYRRRHEPSAGYLVAN